MSNDAMPQGTLEKTDQDVFGLDLEPVTATSSEQEGRTDSAPVEIKAGEDKGAAKPTNAESKDRRVSEKKTKISQDEWQQTQETLRLQAEELALVKFEREQAKFESKHPIVNNEKYSKKWEELCKAKADADHKYHLLDFDDLKNLLLASEPEVLAENEEAIEELERNEDRPLSPPAFSQTTPKPKTPGGVDANTYDWLKQKGYSDEEIADSDNISLTGSTRRR